MLLLKLLQKPGGCDFSHEALQDVDDWDLTELNPEWDIREGRDNASSAGGSGDDVVSPLPPLVSKHVLSFHVFDPMNE